MNLDAVFLRFMGLQGASASATCGGQCLYAFVNNNGNVVVLCVPLFKK